MAENCVTVEQLRKRMVELAAIESSTLKEKVVNTYRVSPVPGAENLVVGLTIRSKTLIGAIIAYLDWVELEDSLNYKLGTYNRVIANHCHNTLDNLDEDIENYVKFTSSNASGDEFIFKVNPVTIEYSDK